MRKLILSLLASILFLSACQSVPSYQDPDTVEYSIEGDYEIDKDIEDAVRVIEENLEYAEKEDMEGYLSTIVPSARVETEKELSSFFEEYDLEHTILSVEVLEKESDVMLLRVEQQAVVLDSAEGAPTYRNHIAEANHTMVKVEDTWMIEETIMTDTFYLD